MMSRFFLLASLFSSLVSFGRTPLDLTVLDEPFNTEGHGFPFPSLRQSQDITKDFFQVTHYALTETVGGWNPWVGKTSVILFDLLMTQLPPGNSWLHEEWHRAIFSRRNISSDNDYNQFPIFKSFTGVTHILDSDLVNLKANQPAELIRLDEAGFESEFELNMRLEKDSFFSGDQTYELPLLWLNYVGTSAYLFTCASSRADRETDDWNQSDGADISKRDFAGLDCTGWVYDLFRPDEPYTARGTHPSGVGINRYKKNSDLTPEMKSFMSEQAYLSLLNLLDPNLIGLAEFEMVNPFTGQSAQWNLSVRHELTSFGYVIDENFFFKSEEAKLLIILHEYFNTTRWYPGIEVQWVRAALPWVSQQDFLTTRLLLWYQPQNQRYNALEGTPGILLGAQLHHQISGAWEIFGEIEGKTAGWVVGNVYLTANVSARIGLSTSFF